MIEIVDDFFNHANKVTKICKKLQSLGFEVYQIKQVSKVYLLAMGNNITHIYYRQAGGE